MLGQKRLSDYEQYQEEVDRYLEENDPYAPLSPLRIDLRRYLEYAEENGITDVSEIPYETLATFLITDNPERVAL